MNINPPAAATPEDFFRQPLPNAPRDLPTDALLSALDRANAILNLLQGDGQYLHEGFHLNHADIMHSLDAVQGLIVGARRMVEYHLDVAC